MASRLFCLSLLLQPVLQLDTGLAVASMLGFDFAAPEGWIPTETEGGYLLRSDHLPGLIVISSHDYSSLEEIVAAPETDRLTVGSTVLQRSSELERLGENGLAARYGGTLDGIPVQAFAISLLNHSSTGGASVLVVVDPSRYSEEYERLGRLIAESISFSANPGGGRQDGSLESRPLSQGDGEAGEKAPFAGLELTFVETSDTGYDGTGYREKEIIGFCADGTFYLHDQDSMAVNAGGGAAHQRSSASTIGQWRAEKRSGQWVLMLTVEGQTVETAVTIGPDEYGDTGYFMAERTYYVTGTAQCL